MEGVTTAILLFIFACVLVPSVVKNRPQFYAAFISLLLILLLGALRLMLYNVSGFQVASGVIIGLLQLVAIVMLFLSAGGLTFREFTGDMGRAFEVIRRGEEEKEVIIPMSGQMPKRPPAASGGGGPRVERGGEEEEHHVETIDMPLGAGWPTKPGSAPPPDAEKQDDKGSIPLE